MLKQARKFVVLTIAGIGLLIYFYGFSLHILPVYQPESTNVIAAPERQIILEVSRGGIARHPDGKLFITYTGSPPKACPT